MSKFYYWEVEKARSASSSELKNWIWEAVEMDQPIPGCISVAACRFVLCERGEDGKGYHNT